jgi:hypothetical protein
MTVMTARRKGQGLPMYKIPPRKALTRRCGHCSPARIVWDRRDVMGLMRTLVNVAVGVAIAKGVQAMSGRSRAGGTTTRTSGTGTGGGLGDMLGGMLGGGTSAQPARQPGRGTPYGRGADRAGLENMMDGILNGASNSGAGTTGGRSGSSSSTAGKTARNPRKNAPQGGLEDLVTGASTGRSGGGFGDLLGGLAGGAIGAATGPRTLPEPREREETLQAAVLLRCMVQAAKCDGDLDADEKAKLMEAMGDATKDEIAFVNAEFAAEVDVDGLARQIPNGMEEKAYLVSLMAINLDQQGEAEYLHQLATALELSHDDVNRLHDQLEAPRIYN